MADAVDRADVRSMMGFSTRFSPLTRTIHDAIADGQIGRVFHVHAQSFSAGLLAAQPRWSWRTDKDRSGTGVIGDIGAHALDTCQYLLGPIVAVASSMHTCIPELVDPATGAKHAQEVDDDTVLLVRFATGAHGSLALSRVGAVHASYPIGRRHMLFSGSGGGLLWENGVATLYPYGGEPKQLEGEPPLWGSTITSSSLAGEGRTSNHSSTRSGPDVMSLPQSTMDCRPRQSWTPRFGHRHPGGGKRSLRSDIGQRDPGISPGGMPGQ